MVTASIAIMILSVALKFYSGHRVHQEPFSSGNVVSDVGATQCRTKDRL